MSKVLQLSTPTVRNQRTLIWLQQQSEAVNWSRWSGVVTSLSDHTRWEDQGARVAGLILTEVDRDQDAFFEELFSISKYILMILLPQSILSLKSEEFWADNFDNVLNLDQILESYPFLMKPWDGTKADAVSIFALLCRYNRVIDCPVSFAHRSNIVFEQGMVPEETYVISQYFVHSNKTRAKEIKECLIRNCACPHVDHVILLNETDLSKEWTDIPHREKIKQVIIKKRLTYSSFLKYVSNNVPLNAFVLLCNADIYMGPSLLDLWKIKLEDRMLALLRWDDPADGEEPVLFGPRADSQDCWVFRSDCIKNRTWDYSVFDFALGQAGCDNAFAGHILRNRFVLSNPALSFQTFHLHNSNIRNYSKKDYIRSDLYINLVPTYIIDTAQEQVPKTNYQSICHELVSFEVRSSSLSNEITYCTMVEKEGRYKWEPSVENHYFEPAIPVYSWKHSCITPNGLVYDPYTIYTGKHTDQDRFVYWNSVKVDIFTPLQKRAAVFAIPFPNTDVFHHWDTYVLQYVSRCARLLVEYPGTACWVPPAFAGGLSSFDWSAIKADPPQGIDFDENTGCWAETVVGFVPGPLSSELGREDIQVLRSLLPSWKAEPSSKICAVLSDETLTQAFIKERITPLLPSDWIIRVVSTVGDYESLVGASLCILIGGKDTQTKWSKLWALPRNCCVIEFQQELALDGECQHLCHVADWKSWVLLLAKGPIRDVQLQVTEQLTKWWKKNEDELA